MTRSWKAKTWLILGGLLVTLGGAGVAYSLADNPGEPKADLVDYAQNNRVHQPGVIGPPTEMLNEILRRPGVHAIVAARIGGPPTGFTGSEGNLPVPEQLALGRWLNSTVVVADDGPGALRAVWEADLVAGALRDAVHAGGGPEIVGSEIALRLPDGRVLEHAFGGIGDIAYQQDFENPSASDLEAQIRRSFAEFGLEVTGFETVAIEQTAPAVVATSSDATSAVTDLHKIVTATFGLPPRYEGYYLEIRDTAGAPVVIRTAAFRSGVGHTWIRADLDPRRAETFDPSQ